MAMQKVYSRINWENYPSDSTPINETNLNKIDSAVDSIDDRVITLDTTKASKSEVSSLVSEITYDEDTGAFTITKMNGSSFTIDTKLEKIAINFTYDPVNEQIIITLDDGTKQYIDLSALITQYEFLESSTIAFEVDSTGKVSAKIKNASVTEEMLQPNYLADIKVQVAKAEKSQSAAELSETNANASAAAAKASETSAAASAAAAKQSETAAKASETAAALSESNAKNYSDDANSAAASASAYQYDAKNSAMAAKQSEAVAKTSEANAKASETAAKTSETNANESASNAQEYASGKTDSAKYYYEQCKAISESFAGSLRPMGTVKFAELPALSLVTAGDMYNISDEFVTTTDFKEGAGNTQAAGTNVYKTFDGMWDCLAGSPVTGVKGANEATFRRGNVNITPENIGALASEGDAKDTTVTFTQATARTNVASGDKMSTLFGKIAKWFADLKTVAFTGSYNDLSNRPTIDNSLSQTSSNAIQNKAVAAAIDSLQKSLPQVTNRIYYAASQTTGTGEYARLKLSEAAIKNDVYSVDKDGTYITLSQGNYLIYGAAIVANSSNIKTAHYLAFDLNTVGNRIAGNLKTFQPNETATLNSFFTISLKAETKIGMEINNNPSSVSTLVIYILKL